MADLETVIYRGVEPDVTTVVLRGRLDLRSATEVRRVLLKLIADYPLAVLVDVANCHPASPSTVMVFSAAHYSDAGPTVVLALINAGDDFRTPAVTAALGQIPAYRTRAEATTALEHGIASQRRISQRFARSTDTPALARDAALQVCEKWGLSALRHSASMVVSELATNAVVHGGGEIRLEAILRGEFLHLRMHDASPQVPALFEGEVTDHGNGLRIVESMSTAWGYVPDPSTGGKVVWATLQARPLRSRASAPPAASR